MKYAITTRRINMKPLKYYKYKNQFYEVIIKRFNDSLLMLFYQPTFIFDLGNYKAKDFSNEIVLQVSNIFVSKLTKQINKSLQIIKKFILSAS